jgi:nucleoside phosphorylase
MQEYIQRSAKTSGTFKLKGHSFPGWGNDQLFKASYSHLNKPEGEGEPETTCSKCDTSETERRLDRDSDYPVVHHGLIASGNQVVRSAEYRDKLREKYNIFCFEMEAAGLMNSFPCLVVRGICDYSDNHKNKLWQPYAATAAAAYARDLLRVIRPQRVREQKFVVEVVAARK